MSEQGKNVDILNRMQAYGVTEKIENTSFSFSKKLVILQHVNKVGCRLLTESKEAI